MVRIFPLVFILLWSSAFITTKPIIDNGDPFAALAFRFFFVAVGFYLFSLYSKQTIIINQKNLIESLFSGVLFHGFYLGGVFYSISIGMPTSIAALIVTLQPVLTNALSGPILGEKVSFKQWDWCFPRIHRSHISFGTRYRIKHTVTRIASNNNSINCNYHVNYMAKKIK